MKNLSSLTILVGVAIFAFCSASHAQLLSDNFSSYNDNDELDAVWPVWSPSALRPIGLGTDPLDPNNQTVESFGGMRTSSIATFVPTDEQPLLFSFRFYDSNDGTNTEFGSIINALSSPSRLLVAGLFHSSIFAGHDNTRYQARSIGIGAPGWFNLATERIEGWREFEFVIRESSFDIYIDGALDANGHNIFYPAGAFSYVRIGSNFQTARSVHYDDVTVVPEPATVALISGAAFLALTVAWRRRKTA